MPEKRCIFLKRTYFGVRCILMSPEEWRKLKRNGKTLKCLTGGNNCPIKLRLVAKHVRAN